jgi:hypothetical protein
MNAPSMKDAIIAKSDQLNSDDLMSGSITIEVTRVEIKSGEQPVSIYYKGDNGKPYKPCKSMCRALVQLWGADAATYVGKRMTIWRDPTVTWGGLAVGGIRISHMSHINESRTLALTATRGSKKAFVVKPLADALVDSALSPMVIEEMKVTGVAEANKGLDKLKAWWSSIGGANQKQIGGAVFLDELKAIAAKVPANEDSIM